MTNDQPRSQRIRARKYLFYRRNVWGLLFAVSFYKYSQCSDLSHLSRVRCWLWLGLPSNPLINSTKEGNKEPLYVMCADELCKSCYTLAAFHISPGANVQSGRRCRYLIRTCALEGTWGEWTRAKVTQEGPWCASTEGNGTWRGSPARVLGVVNLCYMAFTQTSGTFNFGWKKQ